MRPYEAYVYAYPHKSAYRPASPKPRLADLWRGQKRDALAFYAHIPFCEVRCGFCNLFTRIGAPEELGTRYLDALERQALAVRAALDESGPAPRFATAAVGGGTPTFLSAAELVRLFDIVEKTMGVGLGTVPLSVEASPATATPDRLRVLAERGTMRLSLGVQSFDETEARAAVRPQKPAEVAAALDAVRAAGIPVLNIDLIYGIEGQTAQSWLASLRTALEWRPEELFLYPLYVRPLTGLGRRGPAEIPARIPSRAELVAADDAWDTHRLALYRTGRDFLLENGYQQVSMRMFRRTDAPVAGGGEDYACQADGMVGLGCGARSYTSQVHYSFDYAVSREQVQRIIDAYVATDDFDIAEYCFTLTPGEQRRRFLLQSLLQAEGLDPVAFRMRFGAWPEEVFPEEFGLLDARGHLAGPESPRTRLSAEGLAWSDGVGPLFFSAGVRELMRDYELK
jgi:oxygen-independent coproporphyrinogen-3 oxidase